MVTPRTWRSGGRRTLPVLVLLLLSGMAYAGAPAPGTDYARVRHSEGSIRAIRAGSETLETSGLNRPIVPGDRLECPAGRAEVVLPDSAVVWIDRDSVVEFRVLAGPDGGGRADTLDLRRGRLRIEMPGKDRGHAAIHVDTEAGSIYLRSAGSFRIEAEATVTHLASFDGVAEFSGDEGSVLVRGGQSSSVPIHGVPTAPRRFNTDRRDTFDQYIDARVAAYEDPGGPGSATGGAPDGLPDMLTSYLAELTSHGTWHTLPGYGVVWRPHSASGEPTLNSETHRVT